MLGQEIGAANMHPAIGRLVLIDLTAGDGAVEDGALWEKNCTPGLLAFHARNAKKPTTIVLYEIQQATCAGLVRRLASELPRLGYTQTGATRWTSGNTVDFNVIHGSGADIDLAPLWIGPATSALVLNDPNAMSQWAMRSSLAAEIAARTPWFRSISTMGCNVGGLKRLLAIRPGEGIDGWLRSPRSPTLCFHITTCSSRPSTATRRNGPT